MKLNSIIIKYNSERIDSDIVIRYINEPYGEFLDIEYKNLSNKNVVVSFIIKNFKILNYKIYEKKTDLYGKEYSVEFKEQLKDLDIKKIKKIAENILNKIKNFIT